MSPEPLPPGSDRAAATTAHRFLQQLLRDRSAGRERTLAEYQEIFASHPDVVAREYASATRPGDAASFVGDDTPYPGHGDRYRRIATIGRGGMGTVYRAFDPALDREVAMKCLGAEDDATTDSQLLCRFLDEAKITGGLQHPGIAAVHEIGLDADGRPYFTMPLIAGRSLLEIIAAVHRGDDTWPLVRALDVLTRVCETVAYAHERGVVHRDLKPANVLVGSFGEAYVVDWGLARSRHRDDVRDIRIDDHGDDAGSGLRTMEGDVIGTPAYMAPEQARGEVDQVGPRSDVYSLGAMLYHLLAGTPPYGRDGAAATGRETLERLRQSPPAPLSSHPVDIPPEIAAICDRAMARTAADRYPTATALAADLRAFREHRVVAAYASGPVAELGKWVRRNRAVAVASLIALLALVAGFAWSEVQRAAADANAKLAAANADRAADNLDMAVDAGNELLGELGLYGLQDEPGADPIRESLAHKALAYFEQLRDLEGDDPRVADKVAQAHLRIAILETQLGHTDRLATAWQSAREILLALISRHGSSASRHRWLTQTGLELAVRRLQSGDTDAALPELERSEQEIAAMVAATPGDKGLLRDACVATYNLALARMEKRDKDGALRWSAAAVQAARDLAEATDDDIVAVTQVGSALMLRARLMWQLGQMEDAAAGYIEAAAMLESALATTPNHRGARFRLGEILNLHAVLQKQRQQNADAEALFERTVVVFRRLATENPGVRNYHGQLAGALCNLGILFASRDANDRALELYGEALQEVRTALAIDPFASDFRDYRRIIGKEIAIAHVTEGRHREAATALRELLSEQRDGSEWTCGRLFAVCAKAIGFDDDLDADTKARLRGEYGDAAMPLLRAAADAGALKAEALASSAFDAVRERPDFVELQAGLAR